MATKVQNREETTIDYNQNIKQLLGWEDLDIKILKKSFGMLKGFLKKHRFDTKENQERNGKESAKQLNENTLKNK